MVIYKFIFITLLFVFLHTKVVQAQEIKPLCKCSWLVFIVNSNNTISTSANMRTFEKFQRSDDECEKINNLCEIRNKRILQYINCTHQSLNKQKKETSENQCDNDLNRLEEDFTDQFNKILNTTQDKTNKNLSKTK